MLTELPTESTKLSAAACSWCPIVVDSTSKYLSCACWFNAFIWLPGTTVTKKFGPLHFNVGTWHCSILYCLDKPDPWSCLKIDHMDVIFALCVIPQIYICFPGFSNSGCRASQECAGFCLFHHHWLARNLKFMKVKRHICTSHCEVERDVWPKCSFSWQTCYWNRNARDLQLCFGDHGWDDRALAHSDKIIRKTPCWQSWLKMWPVISFLLLGLSGVLRKRLIKGPAQTLGQLSQQEGIKHKATSNVAGPVSRNNSFPTLNKMV